MRDRKYSFTTANSRDLIPLIGTHSREIPNDAQSMTFFLYDGIEPREYFKVEFILGGLGLVNRWFYHGYYFDENGVLQQTFNDFIVEPLSLSELFRLTDTDIHSAMSEWLELKC
ncbi:hypothetical protein [Algoriphagus mannitolivorans]|uniref:hypothetical protein n=1 Tax=Algoriphagus mannitolivorans TaxID=226504 RepID=UPI0004295999|nr:hypothetical protein [Algoriphagus mannitolivorans]